MCVFHATAFGQSFSSFPRSGEPCLPYDSWISSSANAQPAVPLLLDWQSPVAFFEALLDKTLPTWVSHYSCLLASG